MIFKTVTGVFVLIAAFVMVCGKPRPDVIRERHIIRAPIKFKVIHHYKVQEVPIIIKKHVHYFKPHEEVKPVVEHTDHVPNEYFKNQKGKEDHDIWSHGFSFHDDYEDLHHQGLQEDEQYEDYEYE